MGMRKQWGISLVELMVSITVGLVLMAGVVQLFLSSKVTFSAQQAIARAQQTGRLAIDFISEDLRMSGYMGCANFAEKPVKSFLNTTPGLLYRFSNPIEGIDEQAVDAAYPASRLANADALVLRSANGNMVGLQGTSTADHIYIENTDFKKDGCKGAGDVKSDKYSGFCAGDIVVVASCSNGIVFQATNFELTNTLPTDDAPAPAPETETETEAETEAETAKKYVEISHMAGANPGSNAKADWGKSATNGQTVFGSDSQLLRVNTTFYYIASPASGRPGLYRKVNNDNAQELLTGVEDMQLEYGRDNNGDRVPDVFLNASAVVAAAAWDEITAIKVELLVVSMDDNVLEAPQNYFFKGKPVTAKDRRLRQVFTSTIAIRGRMP